MVQGKEPASWRMSVTVRDVAHVAAGYWGESEEGADANLRVDVIRNGDLAATRLRGTTAHRWFTPRQASRAELAPGDLVLSTSGDCGKVALITAPGLFASNFVRGLRVTDPDVSSAWLYLALQSSAAAAALAAHTGGTTIQNLKKGFFDEPFLRVPPLPEQHRIVEILEEQLSRIDAALESVRLVREKAAQFRRSLLHAAFAGPLSRLGADTPSRGGPRLIRLGEVVSSVRNGITYKNAPDSGGLPIARIQTIANGAIDFAKVGYAGLEEVEAKHLLEPGDILFSHINSQAHVGKVALYRPEMQALVHGMNLLRLRPKDSMHPTYLFYALQSAEVRDQVWARTRHAVNQASINIKALSEVRIPAPPTADQQRIVEILDEQLSRLDASMTVADQIEERSASLRRSLLHAAFTGRLTEQWRQEHAHV